MRRVALAAVGAVLSMAAAGCANEGCVGNGKDCKIPSPCKKVALTCDATELKVEKVTAVAQRPGGRNALAAKDDILLGNQFATAVLAGLGNQNYLDPNGGSLLDLATPGRNNDAINQIVQVVGVLPDDAARFTEVEIIDERPARVAVQFKGTLDNRPNFPIATRYEMTPCDRGIRVRTEIFNASTDTQMFSLSDGYYWSKREPIPFAPGVGKGYAYESFGLTTIDNVFRTFPFMAWNAHSGDEESSYATVSCTDKTLEGFQSDTVSSGGLKRTILPPRGYLVFERYIALAPSASVGAATDLALEIRKQVTGESYVTLTGTVERPAALRLDSERETAVLISEGSQASDPKTRTPWNSVVPDKNGKWSARVPGGKSYVVEVQAFGKIVAQKDLGTIAGDTDTGTLAIPGTGKVTFNLKDADTMSPIDGEIFVIPADEKTKTETAGSFFGQFGTCAPWLGPPPGGSPACNRVLIRGGSATAEIPLGNFHFYAFHGPFWTLDRKTLQLTPAAQTVDLALKRLPLQPTGAVSADLHVHGAASFDSSIPDLDRVLSFAASDLDVIVATDHEVNYDYSATVKLLGLDGRMSTIVGNESTGHIPWMRIPNYGFPLVIGHYNFWPLKYDPLMPRNNAPFDEFIEPGELFDRAVEKRDPVVQKPLIELNHPWAEPEFGRDLGFPRALSMDCRKDLPASDDGTAMGRFVRTNKGSKLKNNDHDAQEVMNGSQNDQLVQYRAFWWYSLSQGLLKTGTANSDSHSLTDNTVGMPRNVVFADTQAGPAFDVNKFNTAIRNGRVLGTNGPVIDAKVEGNGFDASWSFEPLKPRAGANVKVTVSAAPWVPVQEIRFIVNAKVVKTIKDGIVQPADPFGATELVRYTGSVPLAELLAGVEGDAWLSIEAGRALVPFDDLGGGLDGSPDGIPDTSDNNGDGKVDAADVGTGRKFGPMSNGADPKETEAGYHYFQITSGYPMAFTNPFLLDRDSDGKFTAPGVKGGR